MQTVHRRLACICSCLLPSFISSQLLSVSLIWKHSLTYVTLQAAWSFWVPYSISCTSQKWEVSCNTQSLMQHFKQPDHLGNISFICKMASLLETLAHLPIERLREILTHSVTHLRITLSGLIIWLDKSVRLFHYPCLLVKDHTLALLVLFLVNPLLNSARLKLICQWIFSNFSFIIMWNYVTKLVWLFSASFFLLLMMGGGAVSGDSLRWSMIGRNVVEGGKSDLHFQVLLPCSRWTLRNVYDRYKTGNKRFWNSLAVLQFWANAWHIMGEGG